MIAAVMAPRRTVRPQRSSLIAGLTPFSPTSRASCACTPNRRSSASTYLRTCCLSTATRTWTFSPLSDSQRLGNGVVHERLGAELGRRDLPAQLAEAESDRLRERDPHALARLPDVEPRHVEPGDAHVVADALLRPGRGCDGDRCEQHQRQRDREPRAQVQMRKGRENPFHSPDSKRNPAFPSRAIPAFAARIDPMCRNIRSLYNFDPPATDEEVRSAALQYVRKISGFTQALEGQRKGVRAGSRCRRRGLGAAPRPARDVGAAEGPRGRGRQGPRPGRAALRGVAAKRHTRDIRGEMGAPARTVCRISERAAAPENLYVSCGRLFVMLALALTVGSVCIEPALASGGRYTVVGGTARNTAEVKKALNASRFDWSLVPEQITIHVVPGKEASSTPGHIWLSPELLSSGMFAWGIVQHEYAHQVDFFLLNDGRSEDSSPRGCMAPPGATKWPAFATIATAASASPRRWPGPTGPTHAMRCVLAPPRTSRPR